MTGIRLEKLFQKGGECSVDTSFVLGKTKNRNLRSEEEIGQEIEFLKKLQSAFIGGTLLYTTEGIRDEISNISAYQRPCGGLMQEESDYLDLIVRTFRRKGKLLLSKRESSLAITLHKDHRTALKNFGLSYEDSNLLISTIARVFYSEERLFLATNDIPMKNAKFYLLDQLRMFQDKVTCIDRYRTMKIKPDLNGSYHLTGL